MSNLQNHNSKAHSEKGPKSAASIIVDGHKYFKATTNYRKLSKDWVVRYRCGYYRSKKCNARISIIFDYDGAETGQMTNDVVH